MQGKLHGLPKGGISPQAWRPRVNQLANNLFDPKSAIALRKPYQHGQLQVVGEYVLASAQIVFDVNGSGNNLIWLELPYAYFHTSNDQGMNLGTFYYERPGANMYIGVVGSTTNNDSSSAILRSGIGVTGNGFGLGPAVTITAGDVLTVNLGYFARV